MSRMSRFRVLPALLLVAAMAAGCLDTVRDGVFGSVDTVDQRAYRAVAIYTGLAGLAEDDRLPSLDAAAHGAVAAAAAARHDGAEIFETRLETAANALRLYAAGAGLDIPLAGGLKAVAFHAAVAVPGVAIEVVRVRRLVNAITAADRDPTDEEWRALWEAADAVHARIQARVRGGM